MTEPMFAVISEDNSQLITLSHRLAATPIEELIIANGTKAIAFAVLAYSKRHGCMSRDVQYATRPYRAPASEVKP